MYPPVQGRNIFFQKNKITPATESGWLATEEDFN